MSEFGWRLPHTFLAPSQKDSNDMMPRPKFLEGNGYALETYLHEAILNSAHR